MYEVYKPSIYNDLLKHTRKSLNCTIKELSVKTSYSTGILSMFENSENILANEKARYLLPFYGLEASNLINFDNELSHLMDQFIHNVVYVEHDFIDSNFQKLLSLFSEVKDSILYTGYHLCQLVYTLYKDNNKETFDLEYLKKNKHYFTDRVQSICNIYLGVYYVRLNKLNIAKKYYDEARINISNNPTHKDLLHYSLATYYMKTKEIFNSIKHCDEAIILFTKNQNTRRLINTNIIIGNQYLKMNDYTNALKINQSSLTHAKSSGYLLEERAILNNIAFIYMMQNKFQEAIPCFEKMPAELMREKHFYAYMICLVEIKDYQKAKKICEIGIDKATLEYFKYMFSIYNNFFNHQSLQKLNNQIIKALSKFDDYLNMFEKEFLHSLIAHHYKELGQIKKAFKYLEKLQQLKN